MTTVKKETAKTPAKQLPTSMATPKAKSPGQSRKRRQKSSSGGGGGVERDRLARACDPSTAAKTQSAPAAKKNTKAKAVSIAKTPEKTDRAPSLLTLAACILAVTDEPMTTKQLVERAVKAGWHGTGRTPVATLSAAIGREIKAKGPEARFKRSGRGLYSLRSEPE